MSYFELLSTTGLPTLEQRRIVLKILFNQSDFQCLSGED